MNQRTPEEQDAEFEWAARLAISLTLVVFAATMVCLAAGVR